MKKLTQQEIKVMDAFKITPNALNLEEWRDGGHYPSTEEVIQVLGNISEEEATAIMESLRSKLLDINYDFISNIEQGTWVMDHYFTLEQLKSLSPEEGIRFLQDWKYWCGYRKESACTAYICIQRAIKYKQGKLYLDDSREEEDYWFLGDNQKGNIFYEKYIERFNKMWEKTHKK